MNWGTIYAIVLLVIEFVRKNPNAIESFRDLVSKIIEILGNDDKVKILFESVNEYKAGRYDVSIQGDFCECLADQLLTSGVSAMDAEAMARERGRLIELIRLILENWDKIAPILLPILLPK